MEYAHKVNQKILPIGGVLRRVFGIPVEIKKLAYHALINSYLQYLVSVWEAATKSNLYPLQVIQNKAIKSVFNFPYTTSTKEIDLKTRLLPIRCMYEFIVVAHIQSHPDEESTISNVHNYEFGKRATMLHGIQLLNKLPYTLKTISNPKLFKKLRNLCRGRVCYPTDISRRRLN
ncbi:hypothetical protein PR048_023725, partial [Dryococelus australis]